MTFGVRMRPAPRPGRWQNHRRFISRGTGSAYRKLQSIKFLFTRDQRAIRDFLSATYPVPFSLRERVLLIRRYLSITHAIRGYHTLAEILTVTDAILQRADRAPVVVEAGVGSGSSTAKLSLATKIARGRLYAFDSFQGIPENDELHHLRDGRPVKFNKGAFRGRLATVERRLVEHGNAEVTELTKGLFSETLPSFERAIDVILLDVDLLSSTRTCLRHLYPKLREDGVLFSQDGHIREIRALFEDENFWRTELQTKPPKVSFLHDGKLVRLTKDR